MLELLVQPASLYLVCHPSQATRLQHHGGTRPDVAVDNSCGGSCVGGAADAHHPPQALGYPAVAGNPASGTSLLLQVYDYCAC